jgi:hypothetical protein
LVKRDVVAAVSGAGIPPLHYNRGPLNPANKEIGPLEEVNRTALVYSVRRVKTKLKHHIGGEGVDGVVVVSDWSGRGQGPTQGKLCSRVALKNRTKLHETRPSPPPTTLCGLQPEGEGVNPGVYAIWETFKKKKMEVPSSGRVGATFGGSTA